MIDLNPEDHVVAVWFARQRRGWDWLGCAVRRAGSSTFDFLYRHRHDKAGQSDPFTAGKDDTHWMSVKIDAVDEPTLLTAVDSLLTEKKIGHVERVLVRGNAQAMMAALEGKAWAHPVATSAEAPYGADFPSGV